MIVLHFVPDELSDEAAAHTLELLYGIAGAFENQYFAHIRRYYDEQRINECPCRHRQLDLFDHHHDDDVEF